MRVLLLLLLSLVGFSQAQMILTSPAFNKFERIPGDYCCDILERDSYRPSVPLVWLRPPAKVQSYVLIMDEMETGRVLWAVKDIPREINSIAVDASETNMPTGSTEIANSDGYDYYSGPCPEPGQENHYRFRLFAMPKTSTEIKLAPNPELVDEKYYLSQVEHDSLYVATLVGNFSFSHEDLARHEKAKKLAEAAGSSATLGSTGSNSPHPTHLRNATIARLLFSQVESHEPIISKRRMANATRPWHVGEKVMQHRYIKPSEVLKPSRPHADLSVPDACQDASEEKLAACMALQAQQPRITTSNDLYCDNISRPGFRIIDSQEVERCSLRVRFSGVSCDKAAFPQQYLCSNKSVSPAVEWKDAPVGTKSFVLLLEHVDTVESDGKLDWIVVNIPLSVNQIAAGASGFQMPPLSVELKNSFHQIGYTSPCQSDLSETVNFKLRLYAMSHPTTAFFLSSEMTLPQLVKKLEKISLCTATTSLPLNPTLAKEIIVPVSRYDMKSREANEESNIPGEINS